MKSAWLNLRRSRYFTGPYNETPEITIMGAPPYSVLPEGCAPDQLGRAIRAVLEASMDEPASLDDALGRAEERTLELARLAGVKDRRTFERKARLVDFDSVGRGEILNPTDRIRKRRVRLDEDREIRPFGSWDEVEAIADELAPLYRGLPVFLVGTGMRPEEALALEWRDVDRAAAVASVERVHSQGVTKPTKKSDRQRRRVPLRARVLAAIDEVPRRLDSPLVFPAKDGSPIKLATFRLRHWTPALRAAGIDHRSVYTCRHTFAAWSIRAGRQIVLPVPDYGDECGADRRHLRPPGARLGGVSPRAAR